MLFRSDGASRRQFSDLLGAELGELIDREGGDTIAAMIAEPVMGAGGVIVPPKGYFERIVPILEAHDILLIVDEVLCGFCRLGTAFGSHHFDLKPDLASIPQSLPSGSIPLSASIPHL